jgi:hypothetical protein
MTTTYAKAYPKLLDWLRYLCAFLLYMYGVSKLAHMQFSLPAATANRPIGSLTGYELTWYYFGYSRTYACILGLTQVAGATLLMFRRTAFLGAAVMLPVMGNILLVNLFILVNDYGPEFMATLILCSLLVILWHERGVLISAFWKSQISESPRSRTLHIVIRVLIVAAVVSIMTAGVINKMHGR